MLSKEVKYETWCYEISSAVQQLQEPGGACHDRGLKARQAEYFVLLLRRIRPSQMMSLSAYYVQVPLISLDSVKPQCGRLISNIGFL